MSKPILSYVNTLEEKNKQLRRALKRLLADLPLPNAWEDEERLMEAKKYAEKVLKEEK